jgi:uncharacterized protein (TIGR00730 family)
MAIDENIFDVNKTSGDSIRSLCVYLGSNIGDDLSLKSAIWDFGLILAKKNIRLICGGGARGLMKELVLAVKSQNGSITSITPKKLFDVEGTSSVIDEQLIVESMGERKYKMYELSDAFVAFPGGVGTLEELVEQLTWRQLGNHNKPVVIYNHSGFWDSLLDLFHVMRKHELITEDRPIEYGVAHNVSQIIPLLMGKEKSCGRLNKRLVI